jgi:hypothetical protein
MEEISNKSMWFYKRALPVGWFVIYVIITVVALFARNWTFAGFGLLFCVFGAILFKTQIWSLPDHVFICDQEILVEVGGQRTSIPFTSIKNVGYDQKYKVVTLSLRDSTWPKNQLRFKPNFGSLGFTVFSAVPDVVTTLIDKVDNARINNLAG